MDARAACRGDAPDTPTELVGAGVHLPVTGRRHRWSHINDEVGSDVNYQNDDTQVVVVATERRDIDLQGLARLLITQPPHPQQDQPAGGVAEHRDAA